MTLEDIRQYCLSRGLTDGTMARIVNDYDDLIHIVEEKDKIIERLRDRVANLETELQIQAKLREKSIEPYKQELERFQRAAKYRINGAKGLADRVVELETEVFSLRNQNKLWECIVADYKKREEEFIKEKMEEEEE